MKITFQTEIEIDNILPSLQERFGIQSPAQKAWDEKVWYAMEKYVPFEYGDFLNHNRSLNDPNQFGTGELIFEADPESGYPYQAVWLWTGRSLFGERFIQRYTNPLSNAYWSNNIIANDMPVLTAEFEQHINSGVV